MDAEELVQKEYGSFNPSFLGVTLLLESPAAYEVLFGFLSSESSPSEASESFGQIAIKSVLDHEARHYHDFLVSPYFSYLLRQRLQASVNGLQAIAAARALPGNCLPVPVTRWLLMSELDRNEQIRNWQLEARRSDGSSWAPVAAPVLSRDVLLSASTPFVAEIGELGAKEEFAAYSFAAARGYAQIENLVPGFSEMDDPALRPGNIFEATAYATQVASVMQAQGLLPAVKLVQFLLDSDLGYARIWRRFFQTALLLAKQEHIDAEEPALTMVALVGVMPLATWCLLGNYGLDGTAACPTVRFERLVLHIVDDYRNARNWSGGLGDRWGYWDSRTGVTPWRQSLEELLKYTQRGVDLYDRIATSWKAADSIPKTVATVLRAYQTEQRQVVEMTLDVPEQFVTPALYLNHTPGALPPPYLKVYLKDFMVPVPRREHPGFRNLIPISGPEGEPYMMHFVLAPHERADELLDAALRVETIMSRSDFAFSEFPLPPDLEKTVRKELEDHTHKSVLRLI